MKLYVKVSYLELLNAAEKLVFEQKIEFLSDLSVKREAAKGNLKLYVKVSHLGLLNAAVQLLFEKK